MTSQESSSEGTAAFGAAAVDAFDLGAMLAEAQLVFESEAETDARNQATAAAENTAKSAEVTIGAAEGVELMAGNRADYQIIYDTASNSFTIIDNRPNAPEGTRTVRDVQSFKFADGEVAAADLASSAPRFATPFLFLQVPENSPGVIPLTATGADGRTITYNIIGGDDRNMFRAVPGSSGNVIAFAYAPNYENDTDADKDGVYEVIVSAVDDTGVGSVQELQIQVTNLDNDPESGLESPAGEAEQLAQPIPQGGSSTPPPELQSEIVVASLETTPQIGIGAIFTEVPAEPVVTPIADPVIDPTAGGGGGSAEPPPPPPPPNTAPVSADGTAALVEEGAHQFTLAEFAFSDADEGDAMTGVRIVSVPATGRLILNDEVIGAGTIVPVSAIAAGSLTFVPFNLTASYTANFGFSVLDRSGDGSAVQNFALAVDADNDAPVAGPSTAALSEDALLVLSLADFPFSDPDADGHLDAVIITAVPDSTQGELKLNGETVVADTVVLAEQVAAGGLVFVPVNQVASYSVSIGFAVRDQGGLVSAPQELVLTIAADNDGPSSADGAVASSEDGAYAFALANFPFSDADRGDGLSAVVITSVPGDGQGRLLLDGQPVAAGTVIPAVAIAAGALSFVPDNRSQSYAVSFDFAVQDQGGLTSPVHQMVVSVTGDNDAPTSASSFAITDEESTYQFALGDFPFQDADVDDSLAEVVITSVPDGAAGQLLLNGIQVAAGATVSAAAIASGGLVFVPANQLALYEVNIGFAVKDAGGIAAAEQVLRLTVGADNDGPTSSDTAVNAREDAPHGFTLADFPFIGPDAGDSLATVVITSLPEAGQGRLLLDGEAIAAGAEIAASAIAAGALSFEPSDELAGYAVTIGFAVRDQGGLTSAIQHLTISVAADDDAPVSHDSTVSAGEDTAYSFNAADFPFAGPDRGDALADIVINTLPDDGQGHLLLNGTALAPGAVVTAAELASGALTFVPANQAADYAANFSFSVRDQAGQASAPQTLTIQIGADNDGPGSADSAAATDEDGPLTLTLDSFPFSDPDQGDSLGGIVITALPNDAAGRLLLNGQVVAVGAVISAAELAAGALAFAPSNKAAGYAVTVGFAVQDQGGLTSPAQVLSITVGADNDGPSSSDSSAKISEDAVYTFSAADFPISDPDLGDGLSGVVITSVPDGSDGKLLLNGEAVSVGAIVSAHALAAGALTFTASNRTAAYDVAIGFAVQDQGGLTSAAHHLTLSIGADNDAPTSSDSLAKTDEDTAYVFSTTDFPFSDPDQGDGLAEIVLTALPARGQGRLFLNGEKVAVGTVVTAEQLAAGALNFVPSNRLDVYETSIGFTVRDQGGLSSVEQVLRLTIGADNDGPTSADTSAATSEDKPYTFGLTDFPFDGPDGDDSLASVVITSVPDATSGRLLLDGKSLAAGAVVPAQAIAAGALTFVPLNQAQDYVLTIGFAVQDQGGLTSAVQRFTLAVSADNDGPASSDSFAKTDEDTAYVFSAADFPISDPDQGDGLAGVVLTTLPARGQGRLVLNEEMVAVGTVVTAEQLAAGALKFVPSNRLDLYEIAIGFTVTDQGGLTSPAQVLRLTVGADNDGPTSADTAAATTENTPYKFVLTDFPFDGPDSDDSLASVVITSVPDATSGRLLLDGKSLAAGAVVPASAIANGGLVFVPLNQTQDYVLTIGFAVQDQGGLTSAVQRFTLAVSADNDGPASSDSFAKTDEDTAYVFSAADFPISDPDQGDGLAGVVLTTLPARGQGRLVLNEEMVAVGTVVTAEQLAAGALKFVPSNRLDLYEIAIGFTVTDQGGLTSPAQVLRLTVGADNDGPTSADTAAATTENTPYKFVLTDFPFDGPDSDDSLASVVITSVPDATSGRLLLDGKSLAAGAVVPVQAIAAGALTFVPTNQAQDYVLTIGFAVQDQGGLTSAIQHLTLSVDADNDGPVSSGSSAKTDEGTPYTFATADFPFRDADLGDGLSGIVITSVPGADQGRLLLNGADVTAGTVISANAIAAGELAFVPMDKTGLYSAGLGFAVMDAAGATSAEHRMEIVVTGDNNAPVITFDGGSATDPILVRQSETAIATMTGMDQDAAPSELVWSLQGSGPLDRSYANDLFMIDPLTGELSFLAAPDNSGHGNLMSSELFKVKVFLSDGANAVGEDVIVQVVPEKLVSLSGSSGDGAMTPGLAALVEAMTRESAAQDFVNEAGLAPFSLDALGANDNPAPAGSLADAASLIDLSDTAEAYVAAGPLAATGDEIFLSESLQTSYGAADEGAESISGDQVLFIIGGDVDGQADLDATALIRALRDDFIL